MVDPSSPVAPRGSTRRPLIAPLGGFVVLYAFLYSAFGVASPFLPAFVESRGIPVEQIGIIFAAGTAVRLLSAPVAGRVADRWQALRLTLGVCAIATAAAALGLLGAWAFWAILAVSLVHALAVAPTTNLADALALAAASGRTMSGGNPRPFEYGWVRGAGSAAFILGSILAGYAVASYGLSVTIWLQAMLMLVVPLALLLVQPIASGLPADTRQATRADALSLAYSPEFRRVVLVAALVLGSHAMHDTFAVIRWTAAGISPQTASLLWSISVGAEVVVFFLIGPWLLNELTPAGSIALAALAGAARWVVSALSTDVAVLMLIQPLHGFTFALLHLACMRLLASIVPLHLAATAQAVYGTVGIGMATALLTLLSGWLYGRLGAHAFLLMSALCLAALPIAARLRLVEEGRRA